MNFSSARPIRAYLDTETTGLEPLEHEIIEIAFVLEEVPENPNEVGKIIRTWESKIRPHHLRAASPRALEVNGYTAEAWAGAPFFADVADEIVDILSRAACLIGHNPKFDTGFLAAAFRREGMNPRIPYHQIDTVTSAYEAWLWNGTGPKLSLDNLRAHIGLPIAKSHSALKDALDCRRVLYAARSALTGIKYDLGPTDEIPEFSSR